RPARARRSRQRTARGLGTRSPRREPQNPSRTNAPHEHGRKSQLSSKGSAPGDVEQEPIRVGLERDLAVLPEGIDVTPKPTRKEVRGGIGRGRVVEVHGDAEAPVARKPPKLAAAHERPSCRADDMEEVDEVLP